MTVGETFLWHNVDDRLQVGVALLWKQGAFRGLANYELIKETPKAPNLRVGFGLQGISTGNPGYFATSEKVFSTSQGSGMAYLGIGFRANENHAHLLGGAKFSPMNGVWTVGMQMDGHEENPFVTYRLRPGTTIGYYWIDRKISGFMLSLSKF